MHPFLFRVICLVWGIQWGFRSSLSISSLLLPILLVIFVWFHRRQTTWVWARRLVLWGAIGFLWGLPQSSLQPLPSGVLPPKNVWVEGRIEGPSRFTEKRVQVRLSDVRIRGLERWLRIPGSVRLSLPQRVDTGDWHRGSLIAARVRLNPVRPLGSPGQPNWGLWQLRNGIQATGWVSDTADVWKVSSSNVNGLVWVDKKRNDFRSWCNEHTHSFTAALLQAIVLGDSSVLPEPIRDEWRDAGFAHLLAISGLHIGLVSWVVFRVFSWIFSLVTLWSRRWPVGSIAGVFAVIAAWTYVGIAGAPVSALRAGWMITGLFGAQWVCRRADSISGLALAMVMVVISDPNAPLDPAFQLSFLAVSSLLIGMSSVEEAATYLSNSVPWSIPRTILRFFIKTSGASLLCTCATAPIVWWYFGDVSLHAIWANILAIPLVAWGLVIPGLVAFIIAGVDHYFLFDLIAVWVDFGAFHALGLAQWVSQSTQSGTITALVMLALLIVLARRVFRWLRRVSYRWILFCLIVLSILFIGTMLPSDSDDLRVTFLAVGHGDCVVIQTPNGKTVLIDSGGDPTGRRRVGRDIVVPALRTLGVYRIDWAIITHPHPDHFLGFNDILGQIPIQRVLISDGSEYGGDYADLLERFRSAHIPIHHAGEWNDEALIDGVRLNVLSANRLDSSARSLNDRSIVMRLSYGSFSVLLTGDIEQKGEAALLRSNQILQSTVLKVAHHGSNTSSRDSFIGAVHPEWAVIQCREGGQFNFPHSEISARFQKRNIPTSVTGFVGTIQIRSDGARWSVNRLL